VKKLFFWAITGSLLSLWLSRIHLRKRPAPSIYLEIETGGKSKDWLITEIGKEFVSHCAKDVMNQKAWKPGRKKKVKFGRCTVGELGFIEPPATEEIRIRICYRGNGLCEPWDAPWIRLALKNQSRSDYFWTAMEEIIDSHGDPRLFIIGLRGEDEPSLCAGWADSDRRLDLNASVVYRISHSSRHTRGSCFFAPHLGGY